MALPAFVALQASGRPDLVAKTHLAELFPYLWILFVLADLFGIAGVAAAWALRIVVDMLALNALAAAQLPVLKQSVIRTSIWFTITMLIFAIFLMMDSLALRLIASVTIVIIAVINLWPVVHSALRDDISAVINGSSGIE
jgi:hypothetical protein